MNTKLLRQKILDLAIRGKLTDQRKSDGTAADLLKEIAAESPSLRPSKRGSNPQQKEITPLDKSEAPFEIPDNWECVRLGDLCNASSGKTPSTSQKEFWNGNILWVTSKDVKQKYIDSTQICLSDLGASSMQLYPPKTMIIVGRSGILRHSLPVAILKKGATINQDLKALVFKDDRVVEFVYSVIKGMEQHLLHEYKKAGTTVDNLNFDLFLTAPIPLPPLAEQQRIVAKIEEIFAEIDTVEKNKELLKTHIKQTRQKILDLAIHGKLVPQDENDEPASVLLEKILQEKTQSDNKKSPKRKKTDDIATSDNRPYEK
ncbi:restriction endonuclease subunit S, partial [Fibrobacter sp. UBA2449]|uniref:restriction endonuclease subunit S n=1 Tax=Fibrobacter sp. UBA2449 TaxID=1946529 RepID=UPI0025C58E59